MLNGLITKHLEKIKTLNPKKPFIIVYKSFPVKFIKEMSQHFPFLNDENLIFSNDKIDLEKIHNNIKITIQNLLSQNDNN